MRRLERTIVTFFIAAATAALCLGSQPVQAQTFMTEDPYFALRLGTAAVSAEASHEVSFNVSAGELEAARVQLTYPNDFAFNGFDALGSTNTRIGSLRLVAAGTGVIFPVRSRDVDSAYGDADANGVYTVGSDPIIEYSRSRADQQFTVHLPLGGDFDAGTTTSPFDLRMSAFLDEGILTNPGTAGPYTVEADLTSVDPDSGGLDDGAGDPPQTFSTEIVLTIGGDDLCSTGPAFNCLQAEKVSLKIKEGKTDAKDSLKWKWSKGDLYLQGATGDPSDQTEYALCVYDSSGGVGVVRTALRVDPGMLWDNKDPKGWKYKDKNGTSDGATKVSLKVKDAGKNQAMVAAKGVNIPMPMPVGGGRYFEQAPNVIVQLINSKGVCWNSEFTTFKKNEDSQFQAKAP